VLKVIIKVININKSLFSVEDIHSNQAMTSRNECFLKPEFLLGQIRCHFCENDEKLSDKREGKFF